VSAFGSEQAGEHAGDRPAIGGLEQSQELN
jgi:hypothetical protein